MAFEARNPSDMKFPSKWIAYFITGIYLVTIGGYISNVEWFNQNIPKFFDQPLVDPYYDNVGDHTFSFPGDSSRSSNAAVIALLQASIGTLPQIVTLFIFYSGLSCATTNLYVASRTLYGLTHHMEQHDPQHKIRSFIANLNTVTTGKHIPIWALLVSLVAVAAWLPFLNVNLVSVSQVC